MIHPDAHRPPTTGIGSTIITPTLPPPYRPERIPRNANRESFALLSEFLISLPSGVSLILREVDVSRQDAVRAGHTSEAEAKQLERRNRLLVLYLEPAKQVALAILQSHQEAHDAAMDTIIRVALKPEEEIENEWGYVKIAARNAALNTIRRRPAPASLTGDLLAAPDADSPDVRAMRIERNRRICARVDELPEVERAVLVLRIYQSKSFAETASILNLTKKQVMRHAGNAILKLRDCFRGEDND